MPQVKPLKTLTVTSPFGDRIIGGHDDDHGGVDYRAAVGDFLYAVGDGVVERTNETAAGGRQLFLQLDDGTRWAFSHLLDVAVSPGDRVEAGEVIGLTGDTGNVTGPHLHVQAQMKPGGALVDPHPLLRNLPAPGSSSSSSTSSAGGLLLGFGALAAVVAAMRS